MGADDEDAVARPKRASGWHIWHLTRHYQSEGEQREVPRQSEERFALAVRGSSDGIWDWDAVSGEVYYSPRFRELVGYTDNDREFGKFQFLLDRTTATGCCK